MVLSLRRAVAALVVAILCGLASPAFAQTEVRVTTDQAIIWGSVARVPLTTVARGTVLDVVGRDGTWYVVRVPPERGGRGEVGIIAAAQVEPVNGGSPPAPPSPSTPPPTGEGGARPSNTVTRRAAPGTPTEVFAVGQVGYSSFVFAQDTFNAIFGTIGVPNFGGGVRVHVQGQWWVEASIDRVVKTGQRVAVVGGQTFPLGISDTVRLLPASVTVGYRHPGRHVTPYLGGSVGLVFYQETSQFAAPSENINDHFPSYSGVVGLEVGPRSGILRTAVEVQVSTVPGAAGATGASAAFNEHNLGGVQVRIKVLAGR
jgi:hypothetical protein